SRAEGQSVCERHYGLRLLAALLAAGLAVCSGRAARAQTANYFATPWIVAPIAPRVSTPPGSAPSAPVAAVPTPGTSNLYNQALAPSQTGTPPVVYTINLGVDEIATDNVYETQSNRVPDLTSLFSAGGTVSADTERVSGLVTLTGLYRRNINDTNFDEFSEYAYAQGQGVIVPGNLYMTVHGTIDDLSAQGGGIQSPLVQAAQSTHAYTISSSPYFVAQVPEVGINVLRYQIGQIWFSNNAPFENVAPVSPQSLTASTDQTAREDFRMAGTLLPEFMTDLSLSATEDNAGNSASGNLQIANGELINEYEVTRWASLIGGAGYEDLHDPEVPVVDGQDAIWDFGGRVRPNEDSYALLLYGRHDEISDFAGEVAWRLTPITDFYAAYTDSLATQQQSVIATNAGSVLGPAGAVSGINFSQSTIIGVLNDSVLNGTPGSDTGLAPMGIPVGTSNNLTALQNGLFRSKILSGSARMIMDSSSLVLTAYDSRQISLTPLYVPSSSGEGAQLSWSTAFSPRLNGVAVAGYTRETGFGAGDVYNIAIGGTYLITDSLALQLRYDLIRRDGEPSSTGYLQNAVTLGLHKFFL
ncbi:MAG TPA: hypothetical protein VMD76_04080, partial [Candidatus Sulfotelmatobacter sp.]|nr:hypothetical protein [Candidatus Sulfotelmatobacter sp.]